MSTYLRGTDTAPVRAPDEPAVIRRLPPGVRYSYVKLIILDPPSPLYIAPWLSTDTDDSIWSLFRGKTFRALDRALRLREQGAAVPDPKIAPPRSRTRRCFDISGSNISWLRSGQAMRFEPPDALADHTNREPTIRRWSDPHDRGARVGARGLGARMPYSSAAGSLGRPPRSASTGR